MMDGEVVPIDVNFPNWDNAVLDEDSHEGNASWDWARAQQGASDPVKGRDVTFDFTSNK